MNFVERLISAGFKRYVSSIEEKKGRYDCRFNPLNGWMGLTVYHPYERFIKDDKVVELSLERYKEKMIKVTISGEVVYENYFGVIPEIKL